MLLPHRSLHISLTAAWVCVALLSQGCLSNTYRIPAQELSRLQATPPDKRGQRLRVVQRFTSDTQPPRGQAWSAQLNGPGPYPTMAYGAPTDLHHGLYFYVHAGPPTWGPWGRGRGYGSYGAGPVHALSDGQGAGKLAVASVPKVAANADTKALIVAVVATAAVVGVGLAVTEGARYDGWLAVHPDHPVHLIEPGGNHSVVHLSKLDTRALQPGTEAIIRRDEGAGSWEGGRAPLHRTGLFYGMGFGRVDVPVPGYATVETAGTVLEFGWFPSQNIGLLASLTLGWDEYTDGSIITLVQPALEAQFIPLRLWRLHLGGFIGLGSSVIEADGGPYRNVLTDATVLQFGGIAQWDLTTRLALTFRSGATNRMEDDSRLALMGTVGLTVY